MHRWLMAAAAASVLCVAGAAHAGWSGGYSGSSCGCGGSQSYDYQSPSDWSYGSQGGYVDGDDSYSYQSNDYVPYESSTYYGSSSGYGRGYGGGYGSAYDYGRSAYGYGRSNYDEAYEHGCE